MSDAHLKLIRPSNFARSCLCPGWSRLAAAVPQPPPSDAAEEGTLLHSRLPPDKPLDDLTDEQRRQVEKARAFVAEKAGASDDTPMYEEPIQLEDAPLAGTADVTFQRDDGSRVVIDLKFGRLPLSETFAAWQGLIYGEAVRYMMPVDVWFYQPRADDADATWHATVTAEDKVTERVNAVLEAAAAPNAPRIPGKEQCAYCPALAWCPEAAMVAAEFAVASREPVHGLSPIQLGHLGGLAKRVEKQAAAVLAAIREILMAGGTVPGFTLETRKGSRHIPDAPAAYEALKDILSLDDFLALIEVPLTALEEEFIAARWQQGDGATKKALREEFYGRLARVIARKPDARVLTYHQKEEHGTGS